jgi:hypothetical protein
MLKTSIIEQNTSPLSARPPVFNTRWSQQFPNSLLPRPTTLFALLRAAIGLLSVKTSLGQSSGEGNNQ